MKELYFSKHKNCTKVFLQKIFFALKLFKNFRNMKEMEEIINNLSKRKSNIIFNQGTNTIKALEYFLKFENKFFSFLFFNYDTYFGGKLLFALQLFKHSKSPGEIADTINKLSITFHQKTNPIC
jgi:hypothetical protein